MNGLTKRQSEILNFIQQYVQNHRYSPSLSEIQKHFGFASINAAAKHLNSLKQKGFLVAKRYSHRSISLPRSLSVKNSTKIISLPLIGIISAGKPIETFAQIITINVPLSMVTNPEQTYILKIQDSSFQEEMLLAGDLIIIEARTVPQPGETIVAIINRNNSVISRYFIDDDLVKLQSHTLHHRPIILKRKDLSIKGVVIASIRNYHA